jgi:hypothetical protein
MAALGRDRPLSTKLTWRGETWASLAKASWLMRRTPRQWARSCPTGGVATPAS